MRFDWSVIVLGISLVVAILAIVAIVHRDGASALSGTGLGALAAALAGALAWRVKQTNGHGSSEDKN